MTTPTLPLAFVDTETDGVHSRRQPWEIAVIRREPDGEEFEWRALVEINLGDTPDDFGIRVGRFHERHPAGRHIARTWLPDSPDWIRPAPPSDDADSEYVTRAAAARAAAHLTHGAAIVGGNPAFDTGTLEPLLRGSALLPTWHYHPIDVRALAVGYLRGRGITVDLPWKASAIAAQLGIDDIPADEVHTALGDARHVMRIYDTVMSGAA